MIKKRRRAESEVRVMRNRFASLVLLLAACLFSGPGDAGEAPSAPVERPVGAPSAASQTTNPAAGKTAEPQIRVVPQRSEPGETLRILFSKELFAGVPPNTLSSRLAVEIGGRVAKIVNLSDDEIDVAAPANLA